MPNRNITKLKQIFMECRMFAPPFAQEGIKQCDDLIREFHFDKLMRLQTIVDIFSSAVPLELIKIHQALLTEMSSAIIRFEHANQFTEEQRVKAFVVYSNNYAFLAGLTSTVGLVGEAFNYVIQSIDPLCKPALGVSFHFNSDMWNQAIDDYQIIDAREILMNQGAVFFYLSRILAHNYRDAHQFYEDTKQWLQTGLDATIDDVKYLCFYSGILAANNRQEVALEVCTKLKSQYEIEKERNPAAAFMIAETLATLFGVMMGESHKEWSEKALSLHTPIPFQSKADLSLNLHLADEKLDQEIIRTIILEFLDELRKEIDNKLINTLQRQRLSHIMIKTVRAAISRGEYDFALEMAYIWRTYSDQAPDTKWGDDAILLIAPTLQLNKVIYLMSYQGETKMLELETQVTLEYLIQVKNSFEGTWTVIANQETPIEPRYYNQGEDIYRSDIYRRALENYFLPDEVANFISGLQIPDNTRIRVLDLTWMNTPIPHLMGLQLNHPSSVLVTDKQNYPRPIHKVCIWCDPDHTLYNSDLERDAIEYLLKNNNILFETYSGDECTLELFKEKYSSTEFDLVWLICHGGFDYDNPLASSLKVTSRENISVEQLNELTPRSDTRRLLVLNACQSGTSSIRYDGMGFMGLGPVLTSESQSVIGHLWSISDFAGAILGALLTYELLAENRAWGQAVNRTRQNLEKGNSHVEQLLSSIVDPNDELLNELKRSSENLTKLYYWGSLTLFE